MDNFTDLRSKISRKFEDIELRLAKKVSVVSSRPGLAVNSASAVKDITLEAVGGEIAGINAGKKVPEPAVQDSESVAERFAKMEDNYEREIRRLKKEQEESAKREIELTAEIKNARKIESEKSRREEEHRTEVERLTEELKQAQRKEREALEKIAELEDNLNKSARQPVKVETVDNQKVSELEGKLGVTAQEVERLEKLLEEKEANLKGLMKSTNSFLDSALKQAQDRMAAFADRTANVIFEKKEYELQLKELKDQYSFIKSELSKKDKIIDDIMKKNSDFIDLLNSKGENELKIAELEKKNLELIDKISAIEFSLSEAEKKAAQQPFPVKSSAIGTDGGAPQEPAEEGDAAKKQGAKFDSAVVNESLTVINKFIGWLGKPTVDVELGNESSRENSG